MAPRDAGRDNDRWSMHRACETRPRSNSSQQPTREPNDLALASAARREGIDCVLRGEVIERSPPQRIRNNTDQLKVSWRLTSLDDQPPAVGGSPVVVDVESADRPLPRPGTCRRCRPDPDDRHRPRDAFRLITPSVDRDRVQLAIPYLLLGSRAESAAETPPPSAGRWGEAETIWNEVAEKHPTADRRDPQLGARRGSRPGLLPSKALARKAIRRHPSTALQATLVWIELKQRDYHKAFGLPDPPEGWFVTTH